MFIKELLGHGCRKGGTAAPWHVQVIDLRRFCLFEDVLAYCLSKWIFSQQRIRH